MWITGAKEASVKEAAIALGYATPTKNSITPCPACGQEHRSSTDRKRGPVGHDNKHVAWKCHRCGARGDVVDFLSFHTHQANYRELNKGDGFVVRNWFADHGYCEPVINGSGPVAKARPREQTQRSLDRPIDVGPRRPPIEELKVLWGKTQTFQAATQEAPLWSEPLIGWLIDRRFSPKLLDESRCVRVLAPPSEHKYPGWWPHQWAGSYRIAAPVFEPDGTFASIHCRNLSGPVKGSPKTRWPHGYEAAGLLMANGQAIKVMRNKASPDLQGLLICEGITDFMRACSQAASESLNLAILAGTSGSFKSLSKIPIPPNLKIFIATDTDDQGDEYAAIICDHLPEHTLFRVPLEA